MSMGEWGSLIGLAIVVVIAILVGAAMKRMR